MVCSTDGYARTKPLASVLHFQPHTMVVGLTGLDLEAASTWPWLTDLISELVEELRQLNADSVFLLLRFATLCHQN